MDTTLDDFTNVQVGNILPQHTDLFNNKNWRYRRANQGHSRLLSLPVELRLKILREILVSQHPIGRRYDHDVVTLPPRWDVNGNLVALGVRVRKRGYALTPAILRTSQHLYTEGIVEIYDQNRLELDITAGFNSPYRSTTRQVCVRNNPLCQNCALVTTLDDELMNWQICDGRAFYDATVERVVLRFRRLLFDVKSALYDNARSNIRRFIRRYGQTNLLNKDIWMQVSYPLVTDASFAKFLHMWRLMRCGSFRFMHRPRDDPVHGDVQQEVVGNSAIVDLEPAYRSLLPLRAVMETAFVEQRMMWEVARMQQMKHQLCIAMETFEFDEFRRLARILMEDFEEEMSDLELEARSKSEELDAVAVARQN